MPAATVLLTSAQPDLREHKRTIANRLQPSRLRYLTTFLLHVPPTYCGRNAIASGRNICPAALGQIRSRRTASSTRELRIDNRVSDPKRARDALHETLERARPW